MRRRPRIPRRLLPYWKVFVELDNRRQWHASGPQPLTYQEIDAYFRVKLRLPPVYCQRLVHFVEQLDNEYLKDVASKQSKEIPANDDSFSSGKR